MDCLLIIIIVLLLMVKLLSLSELMNMQEWTAPTMRRSRHSCAPACPIEHIGYVKKSVYKIANKISQRARAIYSGMDLFVFRYEYLPDGTWELRNSKPCADCTNIIKTVGIRNVYYSETELVDGVHIPKIVKVKAKDLESEHKSYGRRLTTK